MAKPRRQPGDDDVPFLPPALSPYEICAWRTNGRPCQLIATLWVQPTGNYEFNQYGQVTKVLRPGYCAWHYECLVSPRLQEDFEEFERLHTYWLKRPYCNQFVHHPAGYVWVALRGIERTKAERMLVTPCNAADCYVPDLIALAPVSGRPLPPAESREIIAGIMQRITHTLPI